MKRVLLVILLFCFLVPLTEAQALWKTKRVEIVGGIGPSFFFGDVGGFSPAKNILGFRDLSFLQTRFDVNLSFKYRITQDINVRLSLTSANMHASDARGSNEFRGYEASIGLFEPAILGEYYIIKNNSENLWRFARGQQSFLGGILESLDVYLFTGFGGAFYNVKANDKLIARQTLDGLKPGSFSPVIPVGVGSTIAFTPNFSLGAEFAGRYAFKDDLEGFTSPTSKSNDIYYFLNFTVTYKLKTNSSGFPTFR
jgi:hypothetical protein